MIMSEEAKALKKTLQTQLNNVNSDNELKEFMVKMAVSHIMALALMKGRENAHKL
jgi:hypothetical protein